MLQRFSKGGFRQLALRCVKDHVYVLGKGQSECRSQKLHVTLFES